MAIQKCAAEFYRLIFQVNLIEIGILMGVSFRIFKTRKTCELSINSLVLSIIAFACKYVESQVEFQLEDTAVTKALNAQYWIRIMLFIILLVIFIMATLCTEHFEDQPDIWWIAGVTMTSFVLALDNYRIHLTSKDWWMFGSYLEVIALIPQFQLILKSEAVDWGIIMYVIGMYPHDSLAIACTSYDYYRHDMYGNTGQKLIWLKFLLWFGFFLKYMCKPKQTQMEHDKANNPIKVSIISEPNFSRSNNRLLIKPFRQTPREDNETMNKLELMSPN